MLNCIKNNQLNQSVISNKFPISFYENITSTEAIPLEVSWEKFIENSKKPKVSETKDTFLFSPCRLNEKQTRANANVLEISLLVFDIDDAHGKSADEIMELVSKYDAILHTTWSHTPENPRYRLILRLSTPIGINQFNEVRKGFLFFNPELGSIIDKACSDPARAYYLFSYPTERSGYALFKTNQGVPVKPAECILPNVDTPIAKSATSFSLVSAGGFSEGGRNNALTKFIGGLIGMGKSFEETLALGLGWNETLNPPLDEGEVTRTHQSIWRTHYRNHPELFQEQPSEIYSSSKNVDDKYSIISASDLLASPPTPREWLLKDFLPKKIVSSVIAAGGTGKSFLAIHIAVALGAGSSLFSKFIATSPCKVVFISGEDDRNELQYRIHAATQGMPANLIQNVKNNINFIDLADSFELFTNKPSSGEVDMTNVPVNLVRTIKQKLGEEIGLLIVDPVSRFRGGEENSAGDTTRFVQALQYLRDQLNATVLTLHHVNKGAKSNGSNQNNARGSSAFIDGVRLVYELNSLSEEEVKKQYGASSVIPLLMTLKSVKSNYGKPIEPLTLSRRNDGSLELFTMEAGEHQTLCILQEIKISQLSKTQFKQTYGSATGKFGLSEKALLHKLAEFEKAGLVTIPNRGTMQLTKSGESLLTP